MTDKKIQIRNSTAEFLIFTSHAGENSIEVRFQNETIWLSQKMMATLFECSIDNIALHLKDMTLGQQTLDSLSMGKITRRLGFVRWRKE